MSGYAYDLARRFMEDGVALDSDDIQALAEEVLRLHAQQKPGEAPLTAPPVDRDALRQAVVDAQAPPEDHLP